VSTFITLVVSGVAQGSIAILVALGIVVMYKATGAINFAQGDFLTLGAYLGYWLVVLNNMPYWIAYPVVLALMFLAGVLLERVAFAPLRRRPHLMILIATYGVGLFIEAMITLMFGGNPSALPSPIGNLVWAIGGASIPAQNLLIVGITAIATAAFIYMFAKTDIGRKVRTIAANPEVGALVGIRASLLTMLMFGISGATAGLGGLLIGPLLTMTPTMGFGVLLNAFVAAVLGGFDRLTAIAAAAIILSLTQTLTTFYLSSSLAELYPFFILIAVLALRPEGLFRATVRVRF